jgi:hypothetical protein
MRENCNERKTYLHFFPSAVVRSYIASVAMGVNSLQQITLEILRETGTGIRAKYLLFGQSLNWNVWKN